MDTRVPVEFVALIADRLVAAGVPLAERNAALAVLGVIAGNLATQSLACRQSRPPTLPRGSRWIGQRSSTRSNSWPASER